MPEKTVQIDNLILRAFRPVSRELDGARELFAEIKTPPVEEFQAIAQDLRARQGKWLRPGLFLLSIRAAGPLKPEHNAVAAAIEMVHNASLLHDDVLDGASVRRHEPSPNAKWGNRATVLFGDTLLAAAFRLLADSGINEATQGVSRIIQSLCHGEALQAGLGNNLSSLKPRDALVVSDFKTAMFLACVCRSGHLMGGGAEAAANLLGDFGRRLGIAYQVLDDIYDIVGDEAAEGKTLRTDIINSRPTLPLALLLERRADEVAKLMPLQNASGAKSVADLMRQTGVLTESLAEADRQLNLSGEALRRAEESSPAALRGMRPSFQLILDALRHKSAAAEALI